jgi:YjbE family integral membrane protein
MEMSIVSMDFLAALGSLILLDLLLGGDNAVVIAMAANKLSPELRRKAVFIGTAGAVVIRLAMTLIAVWLLTIPYLQAIGGLILLPIAVKLLVPADETGEVKAADNLSAAVRTIIVADAAMGVDNVLAVAGASHGSFLLVVLGFLDQYSHHCRWQHHHWRHHGPLPGGTLCRLCAAGMDGRLHDCAR